MNQKRTYPFRICRRERVSTCWPHHWSTLLLMRLNYIKHLSTSSQHWYVSHSRVLFCHQTSQISILHRHSSSFFVTVQIEDILRKLNRHWYPLQSQFHQRSLRIASINTFFRLLAVTLASIDLIQPLLLWTRIKQKPSITCTSTHWWRTCSSFF